ncbi:NAD(P)-binding oxidoreductase [Ureibacillus aquaedulcis]|uniref:SDR family oxidoreductase n=1 Tax=Ureibacillus aquaedulcis TaxID=3058421 RepID=A0ABT8GQF7_9BACL|nr:NAD(P)-binding oxidoreductase [Ureibacillus sp. BA0131]MDN4493531.1 SDR family oxidoreductase [Ureibacillus sp. BA0131]
MYILVIGASSQIGRCLLNLIIEGGNHRAKVLLQNKAQEAFFNEKGINNFIYRKEEPIGKFIKAVHNLDAVVFADYSIEDLQTDALDEIDETIKLLEALKYTKVKRVVHISTFETSKEDWHHFPEYFRPAMIKNYYIDQWLRLSSLEYTIIHPGELNDKKGTGSVKVVDNDVKRGEISREDVANVVLACLESQSTIKKEFKVISGKLSITEAINTAN